MDLPGETVLRDVGAYSEEGLYGVECDGGDLRSDTAGGGLEWVDFSNGRWIERLEVRTTSARNISGLDRERVRSFWMPVCFARRKSIFNSYSSRDAVPSFTGLRRPYCK